MPYSVIAKQREGIAGFRRSGRFFPSEGATILQDDEITDAIKNEPQLIVTKISARDAAEAKKAPADPVEQLQAERDGAVSQRDNAQEQLRKAQERITALEAQVQAAQQAQGGAKPGDQKPDNK